MKTEIVLRRTIVVRILLCITLLPLTLLFAVALVAAIVEDPELVPVAFNAVLATLFGIPFLLLFRRELRLELHLGPESIALVSGEKRKIIRWDDVTAVRFKAVNVQASGGLLGTVAGAVVAHGRPQARFDSASTNLTVWIGSQQETIRFTSSFRDAGEALERVLEAVDSRLLADAQARLDRHESVEFGKVSVSLRGVEVRGGSPVPFSELEPPYIKRGKLYLTKKNKKLAWKSLTVEKTPNPFVLIELVSSRLPTRVMT